MPGFGLECQLLLPEKERNRPEALDGLMIAAVRLHSSVAGGAGVPTKAAMRWIMTAGGVLSPSPPRRPPATADAQRRHALKLPPAPVMSGAAAEQSASLSLCSAWLVLIDSFWPSHE
jgi:hypothetical protein